MAESAEAPTRLALVTDPHVTRGRDDDEPLYRGRFERAIAQVNRVGVDAVVMPGDLTQEGSVGELDDFKKIIAGFKAPVLYVPGNHDVGDKRVPGKVGGVTDQRVTLYEARVGPSFFAETVVGVRIIGLNAPLLGSGLRRESDQKALLDAELAEPPEQHRIVLSHYPPFLKLPHEPSDPYWNLEPGPRAKLLTQLENGGVKAVLCGHIHRPLMQRHRGIFYFASMPISFGLPREKQPEGWTLVTVMPNGDVTVTPQKLAS